MTDRMREPDLDPQFSEEGEAAAVRAERHALAKARRLWGLLSFMANKLQPEVLAAMKEFKEALNEADDRRAEDDIQVDPMLRHALSDHDAQSPATADELRSLADKMEFACVQGECQFSHPDWRYIDGLRALAATLAAASNPVGGE